MRPEVELPTEEELVAAAEGQPADEKPQTEEQPQEKLLRIQLRNGKTYTGKTHEEIEQALAEDLERTHADMQTRDTQTREMRGKVDYQQEHAAQWDAQKYLDLLGKDPMAARAYQDHFYLGIPEHEDPAAVQSHSYKVAQRVHDTFEISEFQRMNNGVNLSEDDAAKLLRRLDSENLVMTARNLNALYHEGLNQGWLSKPPEAASTAQYQDIELPRSRGASAPRATGGGGSEAPRSGSNKSVEDLEKMSYAEAQAYLRKEGLLQH